jgi:Holliday junction resolvasome RuvABC DNA-binding subunit
VSEAQAKLDVDADGAIESEDLKKLRESKKNKSASEETEIDEDRLAEKIATHYRNVSVGYELGKFLFQSLHDKLAAEGDEAPAEAAPAEAAPAEQAPAGGGSEIDLILQALQELVQEGQITEEQAQQVLMQLQSSVDGGAAPEAPAEAPMEEEPKTAGDLFTEENIAEIEANINSKVAEWVSEGKTDKEITELVKQAAEQDAQFLIDQRNNDSIERNLERKCAALAELGYSEKDIEEYVKAAKEQNEFSLKVDELVSQKVAELQSLGYTETQIDEYLKEAAKEDAKLIKEAQEQEQIKGAILNKVAEERKNKLANVPPEIQQILQALESLLQSGQITEEEAMLVLQELGLTGESAGAEAGAAPGADPAAAAPSPEQAAIPA